MKKNIFTATIVICFILFSACKKTIDHPVIPDLAEVVPGPCTDPPLRVWLMEQYFNWGKEATFISASLELRLSDLANFYTLYYENSPENQYFGIKGEHTDQVKKDFTALKLFWDIKSKNIIVVGAHGSMLQDRSKILKMYKNIYNYDDDKANLYADSIATLFKIYPQFLKGDHSAFTFNQFAIPDTTIANVGLVPAKIIIGDGLLEGFDKLGYGDIAPQAVLAHTRGGALELAKLQKVAEVFFNTGDCEFTVDSHHGTPDQRKKATEWGYNLAINAPERSDILPIDEFAKLFDAGYPTVL